MEEALKCSALTAVIGEMHEISFTASRRLQLAVEQSQVTGFILRKNSQHINTTACVSRWKITPLISESPGRSAWYWFSTLEGGVGANEKWQIWKLGGQMGRWKISTCFQTCIQCASATKENRVKNGQSFCFYLVSSSDYRLVYFTPASPSGCAFCFMHPLTWEDDCHCGKYYC